MTCSFWSTYLLFILQQVWRLFIFLLLLFCLFITLVSALFFRLSAYDNEVNHYLSQWFEQPIHIQTIETRWHYALPTLHLKHIQLKKSQTEQTWVQIDALEVQLDLVASLLQRQWITHHLSIQGGHLTWYVNSPKAQATNDKPLPQPRMQSSKLQQWLAQQRHFALHSTTVTLKQTQGQAFKLEKINATVYKEGQRHTIHAQVFLPTTATSLPLPVGFPATQLQGGWLVFSGVSTWQGQHAQLNGTFRWDKLQLHSQHSAFVLPEKTVGLQINQNLDDELQLRFIDMEELNNSMDITLNNQGLAQFNLYWQQASLQQFVPLLGFLPQMPKQSQLLKTTQPTAILNNVSLQYLSEADWTVATEIKQWHNQAHEKIPAIRGLSGQLYVTADQGIFIFDSPRLHIDAPALFTHSLQLKQLQGRLTWQQRKNQWHLQTNHLQFNSPHIKKASLNSRLSIETNQIDVEKLDVQLTDIDLNHWTDYLPEKHVSAVDRQYFKTLLSKGKAQLQVRTQGTVQQLLDNLTMQLDCDKTQIDFNPEWPQIDKVKAQLSLKKGKVSGILYKAQIFDQMIENTELNISQLFSTSPLLNLKIQQRISAKTGLTYVAQSPLHEELGLGDIELQGQVDLGLNLDIPLSNLPNHYQGTLGFVDNQLTHPQGLHLTELHGKLLFSVGVLHSQQLRATLWQQPLHLDLQQQAHALHIIVTGDLDPDFVTVLNQQLQLAMPEKFIQSLHGNSSWQALLTLPYDNAPITLAIESDLRGLSIDLPPPLHKQRQQKRQFQFNINLDEQQAWQLNYGQQLRARYMENDYGQYVTQVHFGQQPFPISGQKDLQISGQIDSLNIADWSPFLATTSTTNSNPNKTTVAPFSWTIDVFIPVLNTGHHFIKKLKFNAHNQHGLQQDHWLLSLHSPQIQGDVEYYVKENHVLIQLDRLWLVDKSPKSKQNHPIKTQADALDLSRFPDVTLNVTSLKFNQLNLGQVYIEQYTQPHKLSFKTIEVNQPVLQLEAQGDWQKYEQQWFTQFEGTINSADIQTALVDLGYQNQGITSESTAIKFDLFWPDSPNDFDLAQVEGSLDFHLGKGQLLEVDPGVGRLLGLLDLQAIPQRLRLDFSDLINAGLSFDKINGNFFIKNGNAYTDGVQLHSPVAYVEIAGRTGLVDKTYAQDMTIVPHLSNTLPVAATLLGGFGVGAAILVAQKTLQEKIEQAISYQYKITGSWQQPLIEKVWTENNNVDLYEDDLWTK